MTRSGAPQGATTATSPGSRGDGNAGDPELWGDAISGYGIDVHGGEAAGEADEEGLALTPEELGALWPGALWDAAGELVTLEAPR